MRPGVYPVVEVYSSPKTGTMVKRRASCPYAALTAEIVNRRHGAIQLRVPNDDALLDDIFKRDADTPANSIASVLAIGGTDHDDTYFVRRRPRKYGHNDLLVDILGHSPRSELDNTILLPYDYSETAGAPNASVDPDWRWGATGNSTQNGNLEDNPTHIGNPHGEDNTLTPWRLLGTANAAATLDAANAFNGDYYFDVTATTLRDGIAQSFWCYPQDGAFQPTYTIRYRTRDFAAGGATARLAIPHQDGMTIVTGTLDATNNEVYAEVTANNTWQELLVQIVPAPGQTSIDIQLLQTAGTVTTLSWDSIDQPVRGFGIGTQGMYPGTDTPAGMTFEVNKDTVVIEGEYSLQLGCDPGESVYWRQPAVPSATYTARATAHSVAGATWTLQLRTTMGDLIGEQSQTLAAATDTDYEFTVIIPSWIPEGDEVLLVFVNDDTGFETVFVDNVDFAPGLPAANHGDILTTLKTARTNLDPDPPDSLAWIDFDFDATNDSAAVAWAGTHAYSFSVGTTFGQVLDAMEQNGVEFKIIWDRTTRRHKLQAFNPGGMGQDRSGDGQYKIVPRDIIEADSVTDDDPDATWILARSADGELAISEDPNLRTAFGQKEQYVRSGNVNQTAADLATQALEDAIEGSAGVAVEVISDVTVPDLGDVITVDASPAAVRTERVAYRQLSVQNGKATYEIHVNDQVFVTAEQIHAEATRRILRQRAEPTTRAQDATFIPFDRIAVSGAVSPLVYVAGIGAAIDVRSWVASNGGYLCDGFNDEIELQAAIDYAESISGTSGKGSRVIVIDQLYIQAIDAVVLKNGVTLEGLGRGSTIELDSTVTGAGAIIQVNGSRCAIRNLTIYRTGNAGADQWAIKYGATQTTPRVDIDGVYFDDIDGGGAIWALGGWWRVTNCTARTYSRFLRAGNVASSVATYEIYVSDCFIENSPSIPGAVEACFEFEESSGGFTVGSVALHNIVFNNLTSGHPFIVSDAAIESFQINGCHIEGQFDGDKAAVIDLTDSLNGTISGNFFSVSERPGAVAAADLINLSNCADVTIQGNTALADHWQGGNPLRAFIAANNSCTGIKHQNNILTGFEQLVYDTSTAENYLNAEDVLDLDLNESYFSQPGVLAVGSGTYRLYNGFGTSSGFDRHIERIAIQVGTAPTGSTLIVDVNLDGTSIFTTAARRPTIAAGGFVNDANDGNDNGYPNTKIWTAGSYLSIDVDAVGSTVAGSNLVVAVFWRDAGN